MHMHATSFPANNLSSATYVKTPQRTCFATKADSRFQFNTQKYLPGKHVRQYLHIPIFNGRKFFARKHLSTTNAIDLKDEESSMKRTFEEELKNLGVLNVDPSLASHKAHLQYRFNKYFQQSKHLRSMKAALRNFLKDI